MPYSACVRACKYSLVDSCARVQRDDLQDGAQAYCASHEVGTVTYYDRLLTCILNDRETGGRGRGGQARACYQILRHRSDPVRLFKTRSLYTSARGVEHVDPL